MASSKDRQIRAWSIGLTILENSCVLLKRTWSLLITCLCLDICRFSRHLWSVQVSSYGLVCSKSVLKQPRVCRIAYEDRKKIRRNTTIGKKVLKIELTSSKGPHLNSKTGLWGSSSRVNEKNFFFFIANTLAYFVSLSDDGEKCFITPTPTGAYIIQLFTAVIYGFSGAYQSKAPFRCSTLG